MARPLLVLIGGPPGSGKTTLAFALGRAIPLPVVCRDTIKSGLVHTAGVGTPPPGGEIAQAAMDAFYAAAQLLLGRGVSVIAEHPFRRGRSEADVLELVADADAILLHCRIDNVLACERFARRAAEDDGTRHAHPDAHVIERMSQPDYPWHIFEPLDIGVPVVEVDTSDRYEPTLEVLAQRLRRFAHRGP